MLDQQNLEDNVVGEPERYTVSRPGETREEKNKRLANERLKRWRDRQKKQKLGLPFQPAHKPMRLADLDQTKLTKEMIKILRTREQKNESARRLYAQKKMMKKASSHVTNSEL